MSEYGMEVLTPGSTVLLGSGSPAGRSVGSVQTGTTNGSTTADFSLGEPFWVVHSLSTSNNKTQPDVSVSGNVLSWVFNDAYPTNCVIIFGVI